MRRNSQPRSNAIDAPVGLFEQFLVPEQKNRMAPARINPLGKQVRMTRKNLISQNHFFVGGDSILYRAMIQEGLIDSKAHFDSSLELAIQASNLLSVWFKNQCREIDYFSLDFSVDFSQKGVLKMLLSHDRILYGLQTPITSDESDLIRWVAMSSIRRGLASACVDPRDLRNEVCIRFWMGEDNDNAYLEALEDESEYNGEDCEDDNNMLPSEYDELFRCDLEYPKLDAKPLYGKKGLTVLGKKWLKSQIDNPKTRAVALLIKELESAINSHRFSPEFHSPFELSSEEDADDNEFDDDGMILARPAINLTGSRIEDLIFFTDEVCREYMENGEIVENTSVVKTTSVEQTAKYLRDLQAHLKIVARSEALFKIIDVNQEIQ